MIYFTFSDILTKAMMHNGKHRKITNRILVITKTLNTSSIDPRPILDRPAILTTLIFR